MTAPGRRPPPPAGVPVTVPEPHREPTTIEGAILLHLHPYPDERGSFVELVRQRWLEPDVPLQWNVVTNGPGALRGMHWHEEHTDYISPVHGELVVAIIDLRRGSPSERTTWLRRLEVNAPAIIVVPPGVGHGFFSPGRSVVMYGVTRYYDGDDEYGFRWDDPDSGIEWPLGGKQPIVSQRDEAMSRLRDASFLPKWSNEGS